MGDVDISPKIVLSKFGRVARREISYVFEIMEECYSRLEPHEVALVDLYIFERSSSLKTFLEKETKEVGVLSSSFDELFFAMHDAYRGTSRIIVCFERMKKLPNLVKVGGIRHEIGHSVLHGSLLYYLLSLPPTFSDLTNRFDISRQYATNLLYLTSIAVKDYEVTRLLHERGYIKDQIAYAKFMLSVTEEDKLAWKISRGRPLAEILCLVLRLKSAACVAPLLSDPTFGEDLKTLLTESLLYLSTEFPTSQFGMIMEGFLSLGTDTLSNINKMASLVVESIINPLLLG